MSVYNKVTIAPVLTDSDIIETVQVEAVKVMRVPTNLTPKMT